MSNQRGFTITPVEKIPKNAPSKTIEQTMCPKCSNPTATLIETRTDLYEKREIACHECHYYWDSTVLITQLGL